MTLIELLVALTVSGVVLGVGYGALASTLEHRRKVLLVGDAVAEAVTVRSFLSSWLAAATLAEGEGGLGFQGRHDRDGGEDQDEIAFVTMARTPLRSARTLVHLRIDRDERTPERGLVADFGELSGVTHTRRMELVPQASGMKVEYLSGAGPDRVWLRSWSSTAVLPTAVRLTLTAGKGDSLPPLLTLPVLVPTRVIQ